MENLSQIIEQRILPHLETLIQKIMLEGEEMVLDDVEVFKTGDVFLPGKIINGAAYLLTSMTDEKKEAFIPVMKHLIEYTVSMPMKTWGYLNYLTGLNRLKKHGLLEIVVSDIQMAQLKEALDWKHFVDVDDLSLINLPTNYYGVAFGVAGYRTLLGFDEEDYSQRLFDRLLKHVKRYSGEELFMDETAGEGRFDRYSILIPGEVCSLLTEIQLEIPDTLLKMLRKSADICLHLANESGNGISYGRSIGPYGDTAILEVLSIAAQLDLLTREEKEVAYGYSIHIGRKFVNFWIDQDMGSINMWHKGRRTDGYRHKGRILGENFSLSCQLLHIYKQWEKAGFGHEPISEKWPDLLSQMSKFNYYSFAKGSYDRALVVVRDGSHVFSLPLINGGGGTSGDVNGKSYYYATPYLPIPFESRVLEAPSDTYYPQLIPKITLESEDHEIKSVMAVGYMKDIQTYTLDAAYKVKYRQDHLCTVGLEYPKKYSGVSVSTEYTFYPGSIEREDFYLIGSGEKVSNIEMLFSTFSRGAKRVGEQITFESGPIEKIQVVGLYAIEIKVLPDHEAYHTTHERWRTNIHYSKAKISRDICNIKWRIWYR